MIRINAHASNANVQSPMSVSHFDRVVTKRKARFPLHHFAGAGEIFRVIFIENFSFAAEDTFLAALKVENF